MHHYESTPDGARLSRSENFVPYHTDMKATVTSGKVLAVVSELMEESAVLYKEKINYKYPGWRRLCRPSGRARLRIYRLPYHVSDLSRSSHNKKRMPLFFTGSGIRKDLSRWTKRAALPPKPLQRWSGSQCRQILGTFSFSDPISLIRVRQIVQSNRDVSSISLTTPVSQGDWREKYYADKREAFSQYAKDGSNRDTQISKIAHFQGKVVNHDPKLH